MRRVKGLACDLIRTIALRCRATHTYNVCGERGLFGDERNNCIGQRV